MADSNRIEGDRVFCHQCRNTWNRTEGGLTCPQCEGEFAEILSPSTEDAPPWGRDSPGSPNHDHELHDHFPLENLGRPGNGGPTTYHWHSPFGNGGSSFSVSIRRGGLPGGLDRSIEHDFFDMVNTMMGSGRRASSPGTRPGIGLFGGSPRQFPGFAPPPGFGPPGSPNRRNGQNGDEVPIDDIFSMLLDHPPGTPENRDRPTPNTPVAPTNPLAQLLGMLIPGSMHGPHGDYVFNREDLDRVITQMMEQNPQSNAPPPATDAAINALPKKTVAKDMLDDTGKAECTICMENAPIGTEVTVLPCTHWFHHECIKPWLQQNQTCPHCRKGVQQWFDETSNSQSSSSPSSNNRAHSEPGRSRRSSRSVRHDRLSPVGNEHPEGSRSNPVLIPSNPLQQHRQMPGSFGDDSLSPSNEPVPHLRRISRPYAYIPTPSTRPGNSRRESGRSGGGVSSRLSRRNSTTSGSSSGGRGNGSERNGGSEGGVAGWFREHNPFR